MVWMRVVWEVVMLLRTDNHCETVLGGKEGLGERKKYTYAVKEVLGSGSSVLRGFFSGRSRTSWLDTVP